jgi:hypothetical protein
MFGNGASSSTRGNSPHGQKYIYSLHTKEHVYDDGTNAGLLATVSKGQRRVIIQSVRENGFVTDALSMLESETKSGDYSHEINFGKCRRWPKTKLITNLAQNSVLILEI